MAVSDDTVVVGAWDEDSNATGVDGDQGNNGLAQFDAGAAYVFDLKQWEDLGFALAGTNGEPVLVGQGTLVTATLVTLSVTNAAPLAPAWLVIGNAQLGVPFKGGVLVPSPNLVLLFATDAQGDLTVAGTVAPGIPPAFTHYFQVWIADAGGPQGFAASNAISGTTP